MKTNSIIRPLSTEKSLRLMEEENKLIFEISLNSSKKDVKKELEELYDVKVEKVNTMINPHAKKIAFVRFDEESPAVDLASELKLL